MRMYQDGIFIDAADISAIGDITTNQGIFFGTDINQAFDFNGAIAEVRVWNTVLDDQTIEDWQCDSIETSHPQYQNLIGYWKLNEGLGTTEAIDYFPSGNNGTINGATWNEPDSIVVYDYSNTSRPVDVPYILYYTQIQLHNKS